MRQRGQGARQHREDLQGEELDAGGTVALGQQAPSSAHQLSSKGSAALELTPAVDVLLRW